MLETSNGYRTIGLPLTNSVFHRYVYVKEHVSTENNCSVTFPRGKTAFIVNLPAEIDENYVRKLFSRFGVIDCVRLSWKDTQKTSDASEKRLSNNTTTAIVVFRSETDLMSLFQASFIDEPVSTTTDRGLERYKRDYKEKRPGIEAIQHASDQYMAAFDRHEEEETLRVKHLRNKIDDDGFQTVVHSKRVMALESERPPKKQKSKELKDFYRFQMREKKRDQLKELREQFAQDRKLIEQLKKKGKFHPED